VKGCTRVLLLGSGGGRPLPAAFLHACFRCLGVSLPPPPLRASAGNGSSSDNSSNDDAKITDSTVSTNTRALNEIDWRLAEALMKLFSELAKNLKTNVLQASADAVGADGAALAELVSVLGRPGVAAALLPLLGHAQASVRCHCRNQLLFTESSIHEK